MSCHVLADFPIAVVADRFHFKVKGWTNPLSGQVASSSVDDVN